MGARRGAGMRQRWGERGVACKRSFAALTAFLHALTRLQFRSCPSDCFCPTVQSALLQQRSQLQLQSSQGLMQSQPSMQLGSGVGVGSLQQRAQAAGWQASGDLQ